MTGWEGFAFSFLNARVAAQYWPKIVEGLFVTLGLAALIIVAGLALGLALAVLPINATEMRVQLENALECMKKDGTIARLSQQWFGVAPAADDAENTVFPGTGVPELPGYDPTPREPRC